MPRPLLIIIIIWLSLTTAAAAAALYLGFQFRWVAFWGLASLVSFAHAIPGWVYGLFSFSSEFEAHKSKDEEWTRIVGVNGKPSRFWKQVYALPQALTYFVSSLAGFASLYILLNEYLSGMNEITASKAAVLIALFFFAVSGISGALGRILTEQKGLPGIGGS